MPKFDISKHLLERLNLALTAREGLLAGPGMGCLRLFSGFYEGQPDFVAERYAHTLVIHNYSTHPARNIPMVEAVASFYQEHLPWLATGIVKTRHAKTTQERRGILLWGEGVDRRVAENGVRYAVDLTLNQDTSFYLDTRNLRAWAKENLSGKTVLNTFAYTGSLGVAAKAGGATHVVHLDLKRRFLNLAKESYTLNGFPISRNDFIVGDFFPITARMRREGTTFDCVFLDPPFYSATRQGKVDLLSAYVRLINKVRPLVNDNGYLVAVNNAVFLKGYDYYQWLCNLCHSGYLNIEELISVPPDITGYPNTRLTPPPADPSPFNHPTKIAVLRVRRKS